MIKILSSIGNLNTTGYGDSWFVELNLIDGHENETQRATSQGNDQSCWI